ncbi:LysR family transcriptional regulator [Albidovulum sediminicola]|uniref:LysR family transcriptional regulator n=1 Tax=Albidovulum sediminicola TaxID=2984331 RepID=A0ABT2YXZ8_9RHOB|nr:LysR family transcriptional regulator [Defluviimonas sp. WL0075]MCV2863758.1 LysR family transcriptional regulator [Defluviimonas sp. WL0075]
MAIKLEMLRTFRVVAEQGALADAADLLGRTPSAVSMTLARLEENIGAPLFETDRKNRLTRLGEMILEEAVRATDVFDSSMGAIRRLTASTAGTVRIAAVPSIIATLLPGAIARFRFAHPEVRLEISDLDSASVRRRIRLDEADIGILSAAVDEPGEGVTVAADRLGIVYRTDGPIARALAEGEGAPSWSLLALEPLISNPLCSMVESPVVARLLEACNLEARNTTALLSFVREGLGATVLPEGAVPILGSAIGFVRPDDPPTRRALRMICRADRKLGPAAQAFWDVLL